MSRLRTFLEYTIIFTLIFLYILFGFFLFGPRMYTENICTIPEKFQQYTGIDLDDIKTAQAFCSSISCTGFLNDDSGSWSRYNNFKFFNDDSFNSSDDCDIVMYRPNKFFLFVY